MKWTDALPLLLVVHENGSPEGRQFARDELQRMAILLDRFLPETGCLDQPDPPTAPEES